MLLITFQVEVAGRTNSFIEERAEVSQRANKRPFRDFLRWGGVAPDLAII
jgi:hypothetical protein